jgi:hypothetical protein
MGLGIYNFGDLKKFQSELLQTSPFPLKSVVNFPNYVYNSGLIDFRFLDAGYFGFNFSFLSTGARNSLKDYSGEISQDIIVNGCKYGVNYKILFLADSKLNFYLQLKSGIISTTVKFKESLNFHQIDTSLNYNYTYKASIPFIEPVIGVRYFFINNVAVSFNISNEFDFKKDLIKENIETEENKNLVHPNGSKVYADWSGIRSSIGIIVAF